MSKVTSVIDKLYSSNFGKKLANPSATVATAALIATVSNVSKDALNCWYYTTQSFNNKRIPEEQRKFVGSLDLANGILNVVLQILMAFGISDAITSIFDNKIATKEYFSTKDEVVKKVFDSMPENLKKKQPYEEFAKLYKERVKLKKGVARTGFTVLTVNIAMQIITKRILTPLIATPLASVFKKHFEQKEAEKKAAAEQQNKDRVIAEAA